MDRVRIQRLVIYEGPRDWVEKTVEKSIQGTKEVGSDRFIFAVTLQQFPEVIPPPKEPDA